MSMLFIAGGAVSDELRNEFIRLALSSKLKNSLNNNDINNNNNNNNGNNGDLNLVIIPTATTDVSIENRVKSGEYDRWINELSGFTNMKLLHTRDKKIADTEEFIVPLLNCDAIWISGGSQTRLIEAYHNTLTHYTLQKLINNKSHVIIGGTSAGAAVFASSMIRLGNFKQNLSIVDGFNLLYNSIIDQHFLRRNRLQRMITALKLHPKCISFGIDENTAIVIEGDNLKVYGKSYVIIIVLNNNMELCFNTLENDRNIYSLSQLRDGYIYLKS